MSVLLRVVAMGLLQSSQSKQWRVYATHARAEQGLRRLRDSSAAADAPALRRFLPLKSDAQRRKSALAETQLCLLRCAAVSRLSSGSCQHLPPLRRASQSGSTTRVSPYPGEKVWAKISWASAVIVFWSQLTSHRALGTNERCGGQITEETRQRQKESERAGQ